MKKMAKQSGFTLAELLIVVAIIGVLVAISIPLFGPRLEGSRESTDAANLRSAYAAATSAILAGKLDDGSEISPDGDGYADLVYTTDGTLAGASASNSMKGKSTQAGWQGSDLSKELPGGIYFNGNSNKNPLRVLVNMKTNTVQVKFAAGTDDDQFDRTAPADDEEAGGGGEEGGGEGGGG